MTNTQKIQSEWRYRAFRVVDLVRALMNKYPRFMVKPEAYKYKDELVSKVNTICSRRYSSETVLRAQRLVWQEEAGR